jgi:hypothetical protein
MSQGAHPFRWIPPLLVGLCGAVAAEVAVLLLLYDGPGLMRSLTTVLAVEAGTFGAGLWTTPRRRRDLVEAVRRRWIFCLCAFLGAALFSAFWSFVQAAGGTAVGQGLGLAFTAGLPLYACGTVLGGMASLEEVGFPKRRRLVGAAAAVGAAVGFVVTGATLTYVPTPASLLLVCIVILSSGALTFSAVLESAQPLASSGVTESSAADVSGPPPGTTSTFGVVTGGTDPAASASPDTEPGWTSPP